MMPWLDYTEFMEDGHLYPLLIINLSSINPIEEEKSKKMTGRLIKKAFVSPTKVTGVNMTGNPTAQVASLFEEMFKSSFKLSMMSPEMKQTARKFGVDPDEMEPMDTSDDNTTVATGKRTKTN